MEDVTYLRSCIRTVNGIATVIGLMFEYSDESQATVGQVRLDSLTVPQAVDCSKKRLWLSLALTERGFPYVSRVELSCLPMEGPGWVGTNWTGRLEW